MTDLTRTHIALERVRVAIVSLQNARGEVGVVFDSESEVYKLVNAAVESSRDCHREIEAKILKIGRAK